MRDYRTYWRYLRPKVRNARIGILAVALRAIPNESQRVFGLTLLIGVACGLAAVSFHLSILAAERLLIGEVSGASASLWLIAIPALGGLISGFLLMYIFPDARGSGIPQVKAAYEVKGGRLPLKDAIGKFLVSSIQIGSGASLGREGPTVHICACIASFLGRVTALSQVNIKRIVPVGVAAGIAAAFNAPIAAVTFTIEEVVGDLDQTVLSGVIVAAAIAAAIERVILGEHAVFTVVQVYGLHYGSSIVSYAVLGVAAGIISLAFSGSLVRLRGWFRGLASLPLWAKPAIGGLVTGLLAYVGIYFLNTGGVTGGGYAALGTALTGTMTLKVMLCLCLLKAVATVFSYSSGGAGGIFAPSLFIGGMLGGVVGYLDLAVFSHPTNETGAFALVGMGAVFAGVIRAPITSVLIIFEMTGSYGLILPLMISNMTAYAIARHYRPLAIYEELLEQDGIFLPHKKGKGRHEIEKLHVDQFMSTDVKTLFAEMNLHTAMELIERSDFALFPVIGNKGQFLGTATIERVERELASGNGDLPTKKIAIAHPTIFPDQTLSDAILKMNDERAIKLVVLERGPTRKLAGVLTMSDIVRAEAAVFGASGEVSS